MNDSDTLELEIGNTVLQQSQKAKLLGIYIQENLKLHETITDIVRKLQPTIQSFRYANKLTPTKIMKQLYYTHIYPHLIGSISIWGTDDEKLSKQHRKPRYTHDNEETLNSNDGGDFEVSDLFKSHVGREEPVIKVDRNCLSCSGNMS